MINPGSERNARQLATLEITGPKAPIANNETTPAKDAKNPMRAKGFLGAAIGNSVCVFSDSYGLDISSAGNARQETG